MSLSGIIAKLLGKPKTQGAASAGWGGWLDTQEGKEWEAVSEVVYGELETAKVNARKRRIILDDGAKLTINQVAQRIADKAGTDADAVCEHVMLWLEEAADSDDPDRDDEMEMARDIERWIADARRTPQSSK